MIVIGTAGHIDHGKSAVVKRLTGTDPDRLPEEKERGLTIDLGFAFAKTAGREDIAFVDVPGHERFVRNMIAGAGGIDAVMLVVAADDGWMPQSQEHFQITRLLGVRHGIIVINKIDLAEPDWLDLLEEDVRARVAGSFLAGAPLLRVSAATGEGFDALRNHLDEWVSVISSRKDYEKARLFIDRSFVRPGMGGVVTGTLRGGSMEVGQSVLVWPSQKTGKIRTLQSHNDDVKKAEPGQRTAISFTGIDREYLARGGVVSASLEVDHFQHNPVLALSAQLLPESKVPLTDRREVSVLAGTSESQGEIRIFDRSEIKPGEESIVFYRPEKPLHTLVGDRFIMRLPTPMVTLGGGMVLDHLPKFPRRKQLSSFDYLKRRRSGTIDDLIHSELEHRVMVPVERLLEHADIGRSEIEATIEQLKSDGALKLFESYVYAPDVLNTYASRLKEAIERELVEQPHLKGLPAERVYALAGVPRDAASVVLRYMVSEGMLRQAGDEYTVAGREMSLKGVIKQAHDEIMSSLKAQPYAPPTLSELASGGKNNQKAIKFILDTGEAHKCGRDFLFLPEVWEESIAYIREQLERNGQLAVAELREKFGFTRKFAIPVLEETDRIGITRREGDIRVKGSRFEK